MAFYRTSSGGGESAPDYFETVYGQGSSHTYTFPYDMPYVYFSFCRNNPNAWGTYSGSGAVTQVTSVSYNCMVKIENVKSGDTFVTPTFSAGGNYRYIISLVGKKA